MPDLKSISAANDAARSSGDVSQNNTAETGDGLSLGLAVAAARIGVGGTAYSGQSLLLQLEYDSPLSSSLFWGGIVRAGFRKGEQTVKTPEGVPANLEDKGLQASAGLIAGVRLHPAVSLKFGAEYLIDAGEPQSRGWRGSAGLSFNFGPASLGAGVGYVSGGNPGEGIELLFSLSRSFGKGGGAKAKSKPADTSVSAPVAPSPVLPAPPVTLAKTPPDFSEAPSVILPKGKVSFRAGSAQEVAVQFTPTADAVAAVFLDASADASWKGLVSKDRPQKIVVLSALPKKIAPGPHSVRVVLFTNVGDTTPAAEKTASFEIKKTKQASQTRPVKDPEP